MSGQYQQNFLVPPQTSTKKRNSTSSAGGEKHKNKGVSLNHLLDFQFEEEEHNSPFENEEIWNKNRKAPKAKESKFNYMLTNYFFGIRPKATELEIETQFDSLNQRIHQKELFQQYDNALYDSETLIDWDFIEFVETFVQLDEKTSAEQLEKYVCPICLESPIIATITPCGHVYCLFCILKYLFVEHGIQTKNPIYNRFMSLPVTKSPSQQLPARQNANARKSSLQTTNDHSPASPNEIFSQTPPQNENYSALEQNSSSFQENLDGENSDDDPVFFNVSVNDYYSALSDQPDNFSSEQTKAQSSSGKTKFYYNLMNSRYVRSFFKKCPMCNKTVSSRDLKSFSALFKKAYQVGDHISFNLMQRPKQQTIASKVSEDYNENYNFGENFDENLQEYTALPTLTRFSSSFCSYSKKHVQGLQNYQNSDGFDSILSRFKIVYDLEPIISREEKELNDHFKEYSGNKKDRFCFEICKSYLKEKREKWNNEKKPFFLNQFQEKQKNLKKEERKRNKRLKKEKNEPENLKIQEAEAENKPKLEDKEQEKEKEQKNANLLQTQEFDNSFYIFYQAEDNQLIFLHPLNTKMVLHEFGYDFYNLPTKLPQELKIIEVEKKIMNGALRKKHPFLSHLPNGTEFQFVEVDLDAWSTENLKKSKLNSSNSEKSKTNSEEFWISNATVALFSKQIADREAYRHNEILKEKEEERKQLELEEKEKRKRIEEAASWDLISKEYEQMKLEKQKQKQKIEFPSIFESFAIEKDRHAPEKDESSSSSLFVAQNKGKSKQNKNRSNKDKVGWGIDEIQNNFSLETNDYSQQPEKTANVLLETEWGKPQKQQQNFAESSSSASGNDDNNTEIQSEWSTPIFQAKKGGNKKGNKK